MKTSHLKTATASKTRKRILGRYLGVGLVYALGLFIIALQLRSLL